ncbi:hypothetical protein F4561_004763 [Lipingzhangella halophila]|uniref:CDP-alcohol phosphatidyltransferase family protein n=1 Tax=Lipingzhangella halophila TaxID=1783352 RepID=A0A7W7W4T7_9ACTN|nr:hypothetical protein [Lipingzhangella halophila]MBB4933943.1 hypothetical protein [Lipingzhangella halophila]
MADVRERAVRWAGAVIRPASRRVARWAEWASLSGAGVARIGLALAVLAAVWFTEGGPRGAVVGSLLLAAVLFTDSVGAELEGERTDALGAWLALLLARLREYLVYAGLAVGGALTGVADVWVWASGALAALALHESVAVARAAHTPARDTGARAALEAQRARDSPIAAMDPSRPEGGRAAGDPTLTAELLGDAPREPASGAGPGEPIRIRTTPGSRVDAAKWQEGRRRALRRMGAAEPDRKGGAYPATRRPARLGLPHFPARWSQAVRFAVITLTITIWDARVTFVALIVGSVIAICGELAGRPAWETAR